MKYTVNSDLLIVQEIAAAAPLQFPTLQVWQMQTSTKNGANRMRKQSHVESEGVLTLTMSLRMVPSQKYIKKLVRICGVNGDGGQP